jgi:enoyl-[acyl-carrier protein] reductase I
MLLEGKKGLVVGVANKRSLAWGIARAAHREGAQLALSYQGDRLRESVEGLAASLQGSLVLHCDVTADDTVERCFEAIAKEWGNLDFLVHAVAFANREDLEGEFLNTSRDGFTQSLEVSAYSLTALARRAAPLMEGRNGSILTLSYLGAERVIAHYNVMGVAKAALEASVRYLAADLGPRGIRVNGISAGPVRTLAAAGVTGFPKMLDVVKEKAPLRRNVDIDDVGDAAAFFLSDLSRAVTGEVLYVDAGYHHIGI